MQPPPQLDEDGFQLVMTRNSKLRLRQSKTQWSFRIEAKIFTFRLKDSNRGALIQISEQRAALTRSILLPAVATPWLKNTLAYCIQRRTISVPQPTPEGSS